MQQTNFRLVKHLYAIKRVNYLKKQNNKKQSNKQKTETNKHADIQTNQIYA